jgi:hypothetical protein
MPVRGSSGITVRESRRGGALALVPIVLLTISACGGGSSGAGSAGRPLDHAATVTAAAAEAQAACRALDDLGTAGKTTAAQARYTKAVAVAFGRAAGLARQAAQKDPQWTALATAAGKEATAFAIVAKSAEGSATLDAQAVLNAAAQTRKQQPLFEAACATANPASSSPTPSS